jgi:Tfp pilus assembly protein PilN
MRPINLIPLEERRGRGTAPASGRGGGLSYLVIGALVAVLAGVTALVLTNKQISDREADVDQLEQERTAMEARANSLQAFADFKAIQETRTATVTSLAQSRFDWERVMRELALVLPSDVWLTSLTGSVSPDVQTDSAAGATGGASVTGPSLQMSGCTVSHEAVGKFVAALRDIDGVTRVTAFRSELPTGSIGEQSADAGTGASTEAGGSSDCRTREFIAQFDLIVAFDQAPVQAAPGELPPAPTEGAGAAPAPTEQSETQQGAQETQEAANIIPGT